MEKEIEELCYFLLPWVIVIVLGITLFFVILNNDFELSACREEPNTDEINFQPRRAVLNELCNNSENALNCEGNAVFVKFTGTSGVVINCDCNVTESYKKQSEGECYGTSPSPTCPNTVGLSWWININTGQIQSWYGFPDNPALDKPSPVSEEILKGRDCYCTFVKNEFGDIFNISDAEFSCQTIRAGRTLIPVIEEPTNEFSVRNQKFLCDSDYAPYFYYDCIDYDCKIWKELS